MIRVFILAGIRLYRDSLTTMLTRPGAVDVVGAAAITTDAESHIRALRPNVVLLDMSMPEAYAVAHRLHETEPELSVIGLGVSNSETERLRCAEVGIIGYVTEDASLSELLSVIERAARGEAVCSPTMARDLVRMLAALTRERHVEPQQVPLTRREQEIAALLSEDLSNKEIATRLGIEVGTVKNHVHNVLEKLSVRRRSDILKGGATHRASPISAGIFQNGATRGPREQEHASNSR